MSKRLRRIFVYFHFLSVCAEKVSRKKIKDVAGMFTSKTVLLFSRLLFFIFIFFFINSFQMFLLFEQICYFLVRFHETHSEDVTMSGRDTKKVPFVSLPLCRE